MRKQQWLTAVYDAGAVEAKEGQGDLATCARAWWRRSEVDTARHHAVDECPSQKKMSTSPRGSRQAQKLHQLILYLWVWAYPQFSSHGGTQGRR